MPEMIVFVAFFGSIVIGSLIAQAQGRLPTVEELQTEDNARYARAERAE